MAFEKRPKLGDVILEAKLYKIPFGVSKVLSDIACVAGSLEVETQQTLYGLAVKLRAHVLAGKPLAKDLIIKEPGSWWQYFGDYALHKTKED